ncbi:unnamed protein product [Closterium sp. Yama58-4]|nr:unnamed protein product [Closterium sp. Yama58-4]
MFSHFRNAKDGPDNLIDELAASVALGLEVAVDTHYAKSKVPEGALAGAMAFVVTYLWLVSKGRDRAIADTGAKRAAKKAGAPDLNVTIIVAAWKYFRVAVKKSHDAEAVKKHVLDSFEGAGNKSIGPLIYEMVDVVRTWCYDPEAAAKMKGDGMFVECGEDLAKARKCETSRPRAKKTFAKDDKIEEIFDDDA